MRVIDLHASGGRASEAFCSEEGASTENIDIVGKKGSKNQAKSMHGTENMKKRGEGSNQAFPLLLCAYGAFFVRSMASWSGSMVRSSWGPFYREGLILGKRWQDTPLCGRFGGWTPHAHMADSARAPCAWFTMSRHVSRAHTGCTALPRGISGTPIACRPRRREREISPNKGISHCLRVGYGTERADLPHTVTISHKRRNRYFFTVLAISWASSTLFSSAKCQCQI